MTTVPQGGSSNGDRAVLAEFLAAIGFQFPECPWMREARCVYGNVRRFLGKTVLGEDGSPEMDEDEFLRLFDRHFFAERDDRGSTGYESRGLSAAVGECLRCPVWRDCLRYACDDIHSRNSGVAGGTTHWERRAVMTRHGSFLRGVTTEGRHRILERLVYAKAMGFVPFSVPIDRLRGYIMRLRREEPDESWLPEADEEMRE